MPEILIVTGLPRSGTSLMMQILNRMSIPIHSDGVREKDINNPEGYYELEAVKGIVRDNSFLKDAQGKALKIVAPLPIYLDRSLKYRAIVMRRAMNEILRSQEKMLNKDQTSEREKFRVIYESHLNKTLAFFHANGISFIDVDYNLLVSKPHEELLRIIAFCSVSCDVNQLIEVVNPNLYRNRFPD
jgi:hypothetical protein